jgi:hypothetical protein
VADVRRKSNFEGLPLLVGGVAAPKGHSVRERVAS